MNSIAIATLLTAATALTLAAQSNSAGSQQREQIKADRNSTWNERIDLQRNMDELNRSFPPVPRSVQDWKRNQYKNMLEQNREELNRLRERARQVISSSGGSINR
jgi:hypothetical protein